MCAAQRNGKELQRLAAQRQETSAARAAILPGVSKIEALGVRQHDARNDAMRNVITASDVVGVHAATLDVARRGLGECVYIAVHGMALHEVAVAIALDSAYMSSEEETSSRAQGLITLAAGSGA